MSVLQDGHVVCLAAKESVKPVGKGKVAEACYKAFEGSELVTAAKSAGLSPVSVESYDR